MTTPARNAQTAALEALIEAHAIELKLPTVRRRFKALAAEALREQQTPVAYLGALLEAEMAERAERREKRRLIDARFPQIKRLEDFRFADNPKVPQTTIAALAEGSWIDDRESVIFVGDSGTGKTMLATALAVCDDLRIALGNFSREHVDSFKKKTDTLETVMAAYHLETAPNIKKSIEWRQQIVDDGYVKNIKDLKFLSREDLNKPTKKNIIALTRFRLQTIDQYFIPQGIPIDPIKLYGLRKAKSFTESLEIRFHIVNSGYITTRQQLNNLRFYFNKADSGKNLVLDEHIKNINRSYKTMWNFVQAGKKVETIEKFFNEIPNEYRMSVFYRLSPKKRETILDKAKKYRDQASQKWGRKQRFEEILTLLERLGPKKLEI